MSRKRDTNWSRDEITILLDSIMDITRLSAADGKKTTSKEVFEYAAKRMGERGHQSRAERDKCRTKWKKMKEEYTHAKRAREGDNRYKEAPGIQPFYDRIDEFINGNYDNISPHSTIVRRSSSLSNGSSGGANRSLSLSSHEKRASARLAATHASNGTNPNDNQSAKSTATTTIVTRANTTTINEYPSPMHTITSDSSTPYARLNSRQSTGSNNHSSNKTTTSTTNSSNASSTSAIAGSALDATTTTAANPLTTSQKAQEKATNHLANNNNNRGELSIYSAYNECPNSNSASTIGSSHIRSGSNDLTSGSPPEHADISYRVSSGCRQITIFGDHDVDIKFRRDRVTINKIDIDYQTTTEA